MIRYNTMLRNGSCYIWRHDDFPNHTYGARLYAENDKEALKKCVDIDYPIVTSFVMWSNKARSYNAR